MSPDEMLAAEDSSALRRLRREFDGIPAMRGNLEPGGVGGRRTSDDAARDLAQLGWERVRPVRARIRFGRR